MREFFFNPWKHGIIKSLVFQCGLNEDAQAYRKFALSSPKLRSLVIRFSGRWEADMFNYGYQDRHDDDREMEPLDMNEYWETFRLLLASSRTSLEMIRLPASVALTRLNLDGHVFPNVACLVLEFPFRDHVSEQAIHKALRRYNLPQDFQT